MGDSGKNLEITRLGINNGWACMEFDQLLYEECSTEFIGLEMGCASCQAFEFDTFLTWLGWD